MKIHHSGRFYTSLPSGEHITPAHYFLEDDMRLVPAPNHTIGNEVGPWEVGLWFKDDKSQTLYCDPSGTIRSTPPPAAVTHRPAHGGFPGPSDAHQRAAVTAASLGPIEDWADYLKAAPADKALTYDDGKAPLAHLPWAGVDAVAKVQLYGHKKYSDFYNYRKGMEVGRNLSCAIRHIRDFMNGHDIDAESGENHLAHAACRLLFVLQNLADGTAIDDRYSKRKQQRKEAA